MKKNICIIGGGPAGFFASIQAATKNPASQVTIIESTKKPLAKVLVSGGGRCNVTNQTFNIGELITNYPRGSKELRSAFSRFSVEQTVDWFNQHGVTLKTEADRRMFPTTDSSETIANCLKQVAKESGVNLETGKRVTSIKKLENSHFQLHFKGSAPEEVTSLIVTTGGVKSSFKIIEEFGHKIVSPVPSLFTFEISDPLLEDLAGISFPEAKLQLSVGDKTFKQEGPLLITHWGLSGPSIIKLSALAAREFYASGYAAKLKISFLPNFDSESMLKELTQVKAQLGKKQIWGLSLFDLPKRFWTRALDVAKIAPDKRMADCSKTDLKTLTNLLTTKELVVSGKGVFKEEFVTCGGVSLKEVDFKTMQSKLIPSLFFAGEVLDIDGITGGFNFQNAWTTGWIAGDNC